MQVLEWGQKATELMWRVKALADPDGVLSPGVVLNRDPGVHLRNLKTTPEIEEVAYRIASYLANRIFVPTAFEPFDAAHMLREAPANTPEPAGPAASADQPAALLPAAGRASRHVRSAGDLALRLELPARRQLFQLGRDRQQGPLRERADGSRGRRERRPGGGD